MRRLSSLAMPNLASGRRALLADHLLLLLAVTASRWAFRSHALYHMDSVNFALGYGDWIRLLHANDFEVVDLIEVQAPLDGEPHRYEALPSREWSRQWPSEEIWRARKRA